MDRTPSGRPAARWRSLRRPVAGALAALVVAGLFLGVARSAADAWGRAGGAGRVHDALHDLDDATGEEFARHSRRVSHEDPSQAPPAQLADRSAEAAAALERVAGAAGADVSRTLGAYAAFRAAQDAASPGPAADPALVAAEIALRHAVAEDTAAVAASARSDEHLVRVRAAAGSVLLVAAVAAIALQWWRTGRDLARAGLQDPVTSLPNRAALRRLLDRRSRRRRRSACSPSVVVIDLDDFKDVNDTHGHTVGDLLLRDLGSRITTAVGHDGTVGRLGSDEFGVVLCSGADPLVVARRVVAAVDAPFPVSGAMLEISCSVGVAPGGGEGDPFVAADLALYEAKRTGTGEVRVFTADLWAAAQRRVAMRNDLRRAVERGEIRVAYQPIVDLVTADVTWLEALARWHHPDGAVPPAVFVPVAEATGAIVAIERHILRTATAEAAALGVGVSVNISPRHLCEGGVPLLVKAVLDASGLPPGMLLVEVTESALAGEDAEPVLDQLAALRALGVLIGIDDFGTGQSSLARLAMFPVDVLKLDRAFVADPSDRTARHLLPLVADLAARLGLHTVVEGIETRAQLELVQALGFDHGQGYELGRPQTSGREGVEVVPRDMVVTRGSLHPGGVIPHPSKTFDDSRGGSRPSRR